MEISYLKVTRIFKNGVRMSKNEWYNSTTGQYLWYPQLPQSIGKSNLEQVYEYFN